MRQPLVSVILTTKNAAASLPSCLESIRKQTYKNIEIVIVDNHSTDTTTHIALLFTPHVFTKGPERSLQRNFGASKSSGQYLLFLDADMVLTPSVVRECVDIIDRYYALVIPEKSFGSGFWAACKILERESYEGIDWMEAPRFYRKDTFIKLHGFDESLTGPEDFELSQRLKERIGIKSIGRAHSYIFHNEGNLSLAKLLAKKYYYGRQLRRYRKLPESKKYFRAQANIFTRYSLLLKRRTLLNDPIHTIGMLFMKTLEMAALTLGAI